MKIKKISLLCALLMLTGCNPSTPSSSSSSSSLASSTSSSQSHSSVQELEKTTLYMVGDSTVCEFDEPQNYMPRYGYGTQIGNYLNDKVTVNNLALSGRSSKSFLLEENYQILKNSIKAGDYLMIGFGHNDEKAEEARYTNPNGGIDDEGSFQNSLYYNYVKLALDKGATPILASPIVRYSESGDYTGNAVHDVTSTNTNYPGGDYAQAVRDLASEKDIAFIDLTQLTKNQWSKDNTQAMKYHARISPDALDKTHLNLYGANVVSYLIASDLLTSDIPLKNYVKTDISFPDEKTYYIPSPEYEESSYTPPTSTSTIWTNLTSPWQGSVFGDVGGKDKIGTKEFTIEEVEGNIHLVSRNNRGKISGSAGDGIAMYFQQINKDQDFSLSVDVTINSGDFTNNQVGFGIMLRDDMYIDEFLSTTITGDYFVSGSTNFNKGATSSFSKSNGKLSSDQKANLSSFESGTKIKLSLSRKDGVITTTYNDQTYSYNSIDNLAKIDTEYDYIGLFTARNADVTYSNLTYTALNN